MVLQIVLAELTGMPVHLSWIHKPYCLFVHGKPLKQKKDAISVSQMLKHFTHGTWQEKYTNHNSWQNQISIQNMNYFAKHKFICMVKTCVAIIFFLFCGCENNFVTFYNFIHAAYMFTHCNV